MKVAIADIESDGLLLDATTIHCIAIKLVEIDNENNITDTGETRVYASSPLHGVRGTIQDGIEILKEADKVVFHNGIKFDISCIKKIEGVNLWDYCEVDDTLIMSQLAYPNILIIDSNNRKLPPKLKGSHSLKAWGHRLGNYKDVYEDWSKLTEEMIDYCRQDVEVLYSLYCKLLTKNIPKEALWLEYNFARIIQRQEQYGVYFDVKKAEKLHVELLREKDEATKHLHKVFTPLLLPKGKVKKDYKKPYPFKANGVIVVGDHQPIELVAFNPSSRNHIAIWFKRWYNWESPIKTDKGNDKIDESVLKGLEYPEAQVLVHYFNVDKLLGQLAEGNQAWLKNVDNDGRIHGQVNTLGAVSRRCTHSNPNLGQVPSVRAFMGKECRSLFTVPKGKKLVGCDADALELRTLSHYMARYDKGRYAQIVDKGKKEDKTDIHSMNQKAAGLPTRDDAKTFIYALMYGAGEAKLGSIVGGGFAEGKKMKDKFFQKIPALQKLTDTVVGAVRARGFLKALDGNKYFIRSEHSALNTLLQGAGALVMKYWLIFADRNLEKIYTNSSTTNSPQYEWVLNVHDEGQIECDEDIANNVAKILEDTFKEVEEYLDFRIPLKGSADVGDTWAETH